MVVDTFRSDPAMLVIASEETERHPTDSGDKSHQRETGTLR